MQPLGVLGGTFDPVHCGHLRLALEMLEALDLHHVRLIPAASPPHRDVPLAPAGERRRLLAAAVRDVEGLEVDARELEREGPSYTVDTLRSLQQTFPGRPLCLILGMDAFVSLDTWERWRELPHLAHLAVATRPGSVPPQAGEVARMLAERRTDSTAALHEEHAGRVIVLEPPLLDISASRIRERLAAGRSVRYLVPDAVLEALERNDVYPEDTH